MSKTWLITGVSSGFGYEMTKQLLEKGDTVIGTVRNTEKIKELMEQYPVTFDHRILDVTDVPAIHRLVEDVFQKHDRIDVVVSNAGYGLFGCAEELSDEEINHIIATNLTGSIMLIRDSLAAYAGAGRRTDYSDVNLRWAGSIPRQFYVPRH